MSRHDSDLRGALIQPTLALCAALLAVACATAPTGSREPALPDRLAGDSIVRPLALDPALEARILALDPEHISGGDVRATLAKGPAPRIILLHGAVYPAFLMMTSFAKFLEGMGYPTERLRDPRDGAYSQSSYGSSERIAGEIAWYYEHDGVRPMMAGHSQGGMQAVKILYALKGEFGSRLAVWNPSTDTAENRYAIVDPLTGDERPVIGVSVSFASAVAAGGAALMLPNQWSMLHRLRTIPDTVDEFTGFTIPADLIAWSLTGAEDASRYRHNGSAKVRNVMLPFGYNHITIPITHLLARDARARDWINAYVPDAAGEPKQPSDVSGANIVWAAEMWYDIKKHWCLEAQRLIRARRAVVAAPR